jgi:hypothetical protein
VIKLRNLDAADYRRVRGMLRERNAEVRWAAEVTVDNIKRRKGIAAARA